MSGNSKGATVRGNASRRSPAIACASTTRCGRLGERRAATQPGRRPRFRDFRRQRGGTTTAPRTRGATASLKQEPAVPRGSVRRLGGPRTVRRPAGLGPLRTSEIRAPPAARAVQKRVLLCVSPLARGNRGWADRRPSSLGSQLRLSAACRVSPGARQHELPEVDRPRREARQATPGGALPHAREVPVELPPATRRAPR